jgi:hypothetical protein
MLTQTLCRDAGNIRNVIGCIQCGRERPVDWMIRNDDHFGYLRSINGEMLEIGAPSWGVDQCGNGEGQAMRQRFKPIHSNCGNRQAEGQTARR